MTRNRIGARAAPLPGWLERMGAGELSLPPGPAAKCSEAVTGAARLLHAEFRLGSEASGPVLDGLLLAILGAFVKQEAKPLDDAPHYIDAVIERLHDEVGAEIGLASLAELAGVSLEHLSRTFRATTGRTIGEYIRRLRVERARDRLARTDDPLSRVALDLGFYDQSHFTRTFKALVGCTPGRYRRRSRDRPI